jgi:hypothetical protein
VTERLPTYALVPLLRQIADNLDTIAPNSYWDAWSAVYDVIVRNNPQWAADPGIGKSGVQRVVEEIERLYILERTFKAAVSREGRSE